MKGTLIKPNNVQCRNQKSLLLGTIHRLTEQHSQAAMWYLEVTALLKQTSYSVNNPLGPTHSSTHWQTTHVPRTVMTTLWFECNTFDLKNKTSIWKFKFLIRMFHTNKYKPPEESVFTLVLVMMGHSTVHVRGKTEAREADRSPEEASVSLTRYLMLFTSQTNRHREMQNAPKLLSFSLPQGAGVHGSHTQSEVFQLSFTWAPLHWVIFLVRKTLFISEENNSLNMLV